MYNKKGGHQIYEEKKFMEKSSLSGNVGGSRLFSGRMRPGGIYAGRQEE